MKPIFISYSSRHRDLTETLARRLEGASVTLPDGTTGRLTVWWDRELRPGRPFTPDITRALDDAPAVIVIWTDGAVTSDWVYAEAVRAADQRKIVTVRNKGLDPRRIPLPFNIVHTCAFDDHPAILSAIQKIIAGERSELPADLPGAGFRNWLLDPKQEALPARAVALRPASLLVARHRIVPFIDIHGLRENFIAWATGTPAHALGRRALGRLVHGAGGLGKTRAMIEIADTLTREHGWLAGFVPRGVRGAIPGDDPFDRFILGGRDAAGLLLAVDYAESRQDDVVWLADRLMARAGRGAPPARLVLLSRGAGDWWRELVRRSQSLQDLFGLGSGQYDEIEIPERIAPADRLRMFGMAVESFGTLRNELNPDAAAGCMPPKSGTFVRAIESGDDYDRPLAVQMAALLHVCGVEAGPGTHSVAHLLDLVLGLEYARWDKTLNLGGRANLREAIRHGVAQLTLVDGVDTPAAGAALTGADPFYRAATDINLPDTQRALASLFPRPGGGLAPLEPDLIGEHHVAEVTGAALLDACLAWAGDGSGRRRQIVTVLQRATRHEHGPMAGRAATLLDHLVVSHAKALAADMVAVMVDTPGALLGRFEQHLATLDEETLAAVGDALPLQSLALMEFSREVAMRLAGYARETYTGPASAFSPGGRESLLSRLAGLVTRALWLPFGSGRHEASLGRLATGLNNLGVRLSNLGRREEALAASQEAVDIYRRLAQTRPDAFLPDLAMSLNNLGKDLSNLGRREEALAASQEAVDIYRRLAQTRPDAFLPDLATSLNNISVYLSNLGQREEALAASQEAVDILRRLAQTRPDAFLPDLASRLNNLGIHLSNLGRREEALAASQEAAGIYRRLAQTRPDAFLPDLASSLNNLGVRLSDLGRREEALAASQEAVDVYRRLAQTRPDAFLPDLASSLNNLGIRLSHLGRREEALAASQEAAGIYRRLAQTRPDAFLPDLARSLNNLGLRLSDLGRREEALAASQEAAGIYRRLAQTRPDAFLPDLAGSLNNLGNCLSDLGRREEALAASQEAVAIKRRLAQTRPDAFLPDLASSLNNLGRSLSNVGRLEEALAATQEAVDVRRRLAQTRPDAFLPDLASSLNNAGAMLSDLGRREEALAASQEAAGIRRRLAQTRPAAFLPDLAMSLSNLGGDLSNLGRGEEALAASQEAAGIFRRLAQTRPAAFLPNLASSLNNLGLRLSDLGRREEALAASQEAVDIRRRLAQTRPDAFLPDLASSLNNLGLRLSDLGRREEALAASQEAVDIRRRLAQTRPDAFLPNLARSLGVQGNALAQAERHADAAGAFREGLAIIAPFVERHPRLFGDLARFLSQVYPAACEKAGTASDMALLESVTRTLGGGPDAG